MKYGHQFGSFSLYLQDPKTNLNQWPISLFGDIINHCDYAFSHLFVSEWLKASWNVFPPKKINFQTAGFAFLGAGLATDLGEVKQEGQAGIHCEDLEMGNLQLFHWMMPFKLRHGRDTVDTARNVQNLYFFLGICAISTGAGFLKHQQ